MMLRKCCTQYASKFGKLSSGHRTGKGQFSFQSQRKAIPKMLKLPQNFTHLTRWQSNTLKVLQARLQQYTSCELPGVQVGFRKGRGTRDQIANIHWLKKQESSRKKKKTSISALLTMPKTLTMWTTTNCGKS